MAALVRWGLSMRASAPHAADRGAPGRTSAAHAAGIVGPERSGRVWRYGDRAVGEEIERSDAHNRAPLGQG
jgi:hypothetical protein